MRVRAKMPSASSSAVYSVAADTALHPLSGTPTAWCSCPNWRFQKKHPALRHCKHTRAFLRVAKESERTGSMAVLVSMCQDVEVESGPMAGWVDSVRLAPASRFEVLDFDVTPVTIPDAPGRVVDL